MNTIITVVGIDGSIIGWANTEKEAAEIKREYMSNLG